MSIPKHSPMLSSYDLHLLGEGRHFRSYDAIDCLRELNSAVYQDHPDAVMAAEESTAWPMVSKPTYLGGLGFGAKWNMGWMHDVLDYLSHDSVHRSYHHGRITFSLMYAFAEHFIPPLSHDEVVHPKRSMIEKMPGDEWREWNHDAALYALDDEPRGFECVIVFRPAAGGAP